MVKVYILWVFLSLIIGACGSEKSSAERTRLPVEEKVDGVDSVYEPSNSISEPSVDTIEIKISDLERSIIDAGLVNIKEVDSTIKVDLKYSSTDNFIHLDVYGALEDCYLQEDVAVKLSRAQQLLKERYPQYCLLVYDGVRPLSVQKLLWDTIDVPERIKHFYVAHPDSGSIHNYGAAVDLTIVDSVGNPLDMGTPFDFFGKLAYPVREMEMLNEGKLTTAQVNNRLILRNVMLDAGFTSITTEWWHFNSCSRKRAERVYKKVP